MLKIGDKAPKFTLLGITEGGEEREFNLSDFLGQKVIIYFYPKDNTPGCTTEACDFRDNYEKFKEAGYQILGISPDSLKSHLKFQQKHGLSFPLLSDPEKEISLKWGAYGEKKMYGKVRMGIIRSTFVVDEEGKIEKAYYNVRAKGHVERILRELGL